MEKRTGFLGLSGKTLSAGVFVFVFFAAGCSHGGGGDDDIWLNDLKNPFIGEWKSDTAEDGTRLTLDGSSNGTFRYKMEGVPKEMGLPENGDGGYIIRDNIIVSFFDFGMIKSNIFTVIDNDTVSMTEFTLDEAGQKVIGGAINFRRAGEASSKVNQPVVLTENIFTGKKWYANIPEPEIPGYSYPSTWEFKRDGTVICTFLGLGEALGFDSEDAPYTFGYVILDDKLVLFTESAEGNEVKVHQFVQQNASTVNMTEMIVANNFVTQAGDVTIPYTLVP
jgi:hypothetical protein